MGLVYFPTFGGFLWLNMVNVGKYASPMDAMAM